MCRQRPQPEAGRRQGDLYLSTWDGGQLDGVEISNNIFYWNPPIDAPALQMDHADFTGDMPNQFRDNLIYSAVPRFVHSSQSLRFDRNRYWYPGQHKPAWDYGGLIYQGFAAFQTGSGQEKSGSFEDPHLTKTLGQSPSGAAKRLTVKGFPGHWSLVSFLKPDDADSRSQLVSLQAAVAQYRDLGLDVAVVIPGAHRNLQYDWDLGNISLIERDAAEVREWPTTVLISPEGSVEAQWSGLTPPASLGLTLRALVGTPAGALPVALPY